MSTKSTDDNARRDSMRALARPSVWTLSYIALFLLLAKVGCTLTPQDIFGGTYERVDAESGVKEIWSIVPTGMNLTITIKTEALNGGSCEIRSFVATIDEIEVGDLEFASAAGTLDGIPVDITVNEGVLSVNFENSNEATQYTQVSGFIEDQNLSCEGEGEGEGSGVFNGTWLLSGAEDALEEIWSVVQLDNQLTITRRQIFAADNACVIVSFEAVVSDTDPNSAVGDAFNLSLALQINEAGQLLATSGSGPASIYNQTNTAAEELSPCPPGTVPF